MWIPKPGLLIFTSKASTKRKLSTLSSPGEDRRGSERFASQSARHDVAEDEATYEDSTQVIMEVPRELVPTIRELIAKHKRSRRA
jgi:hypothetical protein